MKYCLVKSEPVKYPIENSTDDGQAFWDVVRNYKARIHRDSMEIPETALFYDNNKGMEIVGPAWLIHTTYPDYNAEESGRVMHDLVCKVTFHKTLTKMNALPVLNQMQLGKKSRHTLSPVAPEESDILNHLSHPA